MTREEQIKWLNRLIEGRKDPRGDTEIDIALKEAVKTLTEQRTGHWINIKDDDGVPIMYFWKCSICGAMFEDKDDGWYKEYGFKEYDYCPKCGAKMDVSESVS